MTTQNPSPSQGSAQAEFSDEDRWIQTYTGRKFYPFSPRIEGLDLEDIAHALAMKVRFTGHASHFYSIAQHSVAVSNYCAEPHYGLMHDAAEAYLPDVARPLKSCYGVHRSAEHEILRVILDWCGLIHNEAGEFLRPEAPDSVKVADLRILATERRDLMPGNIIELPWPGLEGIEPYQESIRPLPWRKSKALFLTRFHDLFAVDLRDGRYGRWRPREVSHG